MKSPCPTTCDVAQTISLIGGKWKCIILFYLLDETLRFSELQRHIPDITQRMLTLQLRELEADGIVYRNVYQEIPPRVEYSLTPLGNTLKPIILTMKEWGGTYKKTYAKEIR